MRSANSYLLACLCFSAILGFAAGRAGREAPLDGVSRRPSSVESVNDISKLPCPTEEQFQNLLRRLNMKTPPEGTSTCDDSMRGRLAKLFFLLESLAESQVPEGWGGVAYEMVKNPLEYVSETTPKLELDLTQKNSIAYNGGGHGVYLGGLFFSADPLEALMVLVHEARHSVRTDPAHELCRTGDIPKTKGGCDAKFSISPDAGAYSFSVLFYLGLAQFHPRLAEADREYLLSSAMTVLGNRFNEVPGFLATPHDLLFVRGESGHAFLLNPYDLEPEPVPAFAPAGSIERVDHNPKNSGTLLLNSAGQMFTWSRAQGTYRLDSDVVPADLRLRDVNKFYVSADEYASTGFLTEAGRLLFIDHDLQSGAPMLREFRVQPQSFGIHPQRIFTGDMFSTFVLGENGSLNQLIISTRGGPASNRFAPFRPFADRRWSQATGGVAYDALYGISEGELFRLSTKDGVSGFYAVSSDFQGRGKLVKYFEGSNFRLLLNESGEIFLRRFESGLESRLAPAEKLGEKITDFTLARHYAVAETLKEPKRNELAAFFLACQAREVREDPWLGRPIGIGGNGYLVIAGPEGECRELKKLGRVHSYQFTASPAQKENYYFPQVSLELTYDDGLKRTVYPYSAAFR